jgi:hypothetical protein
MKNKQSIVGRHAFHRLLVEAISQPTENEKALIREALLQQLGLEDSKISKCGNLESCCWPSNNVTCNRCDSAHAAMARLAEYLKELAKLLGSEERVHFLRVDEGSANCLMEVEPEYEPVISERVRLAQAGHANRTPTKPSKRFRIFYTMTITPP